MANEVDNVMFDILLHSAGSGRLPHGGNVQDFYASPDDIEQCRRWFAERDMILHATAFGLSGSAPREQFESVFAAKLSPNDSKQGQPGYKVLVEPKPPDDLREMIDQVSVISVPELFG
jgi:hypothetical protein